MHGTGVRSFWSMRHVGRLWGSGEGMGYSMGGGYRTWGTGHLREKHGMGIEAERTSDTVAWTCRHKKGGSSLSSISSLAVWFFFLN